MDASDLQGEKGCDIREMPQTPLNLWLLICIQPDEHVIWKMDMDFETQIVKQAYSDPNLAAEVLSNTHIILC